MEKKKLIEKLSKSYQTIGVGVLILGLVLILVPVSPYIWYLINPQATDAEIEALSAEIIPEREVIVEKEVDKQLPPVDESLTSLPHVVIDKIGVYSPINTGDNYTLALKSGSWIVPEFGDPINNSESIIIASHRFGYSSWSRETRDKISYYNLPKTEVGDTIEIIWDQRRFEYEIYKAEENTYITDYDADLILYTCKFYNSPIRIFRYAKAVN
jgi:sortase (surface protein transpeptidase)